MTDFMRILASIIAPWRAFRRWLVMKLSRKRQEIDRNLDRHPSTMTNFDVIMKDRYPLPGTRIKQYVVDERREEAWADATCPRVLVIPHTRIVDDIESGCIEGHVQWHKLENGCELCGAVQYATRDLDRVQQWLSLKAARPPICSDRTVLSNEIAPDWTIMSKHPLFKMAPRSKP